jgi:amino acid permease
VAQALRWFVLVFGLVCIGIALVHISLGPVSIPGSVPVNATMDSEDRFYATLFLGFGAALVWCSRDLAGRGREFLALQAVFFLGGVARLISWTQVGPPLPLFVVLGAIELVLPALLWAWLRRAHPAAM